MLEENDDARAAYLPSDPRRQYGLVIRSSVPTVSSYTEYRPIIRYDFFFSCAYCTMCESEAQAIRFTIDHYEPKSARPDLANTYENLMYACDFCNTRKGDRVEPKAARDAGIRFFRPDRDLFEDHFERNGIRLLGKTEVGSYTIDAIDLNRLQLRKLRELRHRLYACEEAVSEGLRALRSFPIDKLPREIRGRAVALVRGAEHSSTDLASALEQLLANEAKSPLLDLDEDKDYSIARQNALRKREALHPGVWRAKATAK